MEFKIAFFTEGIHTGKVPSHHPNLRTDLAWQVLLNSDHHNIWTWNQDKSYDLGIVILPKNKQVSIEAFATIKANCKKVAIMQEGPCRYWTDYSLIDQINYLNIIDSADFLFCHNNSDFKYYKGLFGKPVYTLTTVLIPDSIPEIHTSFRHTREVIIGGNMCGWYNGMTSLIVARNYSKYVYVPSMGRKIPDEERLAELLHLPYMSWSEWMVELSKFKVAVHLMPTVAAGTFALNCAYFGIPCIGSNKVDTQRYCHPDLSIDVDDVAKAQELIIQLKEDQEFYAECSEKAGRLYMQIYRPDMFLKRMKKIFTEMFDIQDGIEINFV